MTDTAPTREECIEALKPFADVADDFDADGRTLRDEDGIYANKTGDFRRAREVYHALSRAATKTEGEETEGWVDCDLCRGSGVQVVKVHEQGRDFPQDATVRRVCQCCGGKGKIPPKPKNTLVPASNTTQILLDILVTMKHARTFICTREKMHQDGIALYDVDIERLEAAALSTSSPAQEAEPVAHLGKRPVAFRVKDFADTWILFHDEAMANGYQEDGHLVQGLYVRDGTRPFTTGELFNALIEGINFDGADPRTFTLAEIERAIDGADCNLGREQKAAHPPSAQPAPAVEREAIARAICRSDDSPGVPSCVMDDHPEREPCNETNCRRFKQADAIIALIGGRQS